MWWRSRADGRGAERNRVRAWAAEPDCAPAIRPLTTASRPINGATMLAAANIQAIYRYPVKGLSPEPMQRAWLAGGEPLPGDRLYAIENGPSHFDPALPRHQPKTRYLMLMRNERLATLRTRFDPPSRMLVIAYEGREAV